MSLTVLGDLTRRLDQRRGACALIAIKERSRCKTRLSEALAPEARAPPRALDARGGAFSRRGDAQTVRQIIVVSPERDSVSAEIPVLADTGEGLNSALTQAHRVLRDFGSREVVILPADLPTLTAADIDALVRAGRSGGFAIAPDTAGTGTNALCLVSAAAFSFPVRPRQPGDCTCRKRSVRGLRPQMVHLPGLEFDVDSPADLAAARWAAMARASSGLSALLRAAEAGRRPDPGEAASG